MLTLRPGKLGAKMTRPPYGPPPGGPYGPYGPYGQQPGFPPHGFPPPMPVAPPPMAMQMRPPMPPPPPMGPPVAPSWHPQPPPFRPRKSNTGLTVTLSLIGVLVVTAGLIVLLASGSKKKTDTVADSGYDNYPTSSGAYPTSSNTVSSTTSTTSTTSSTSSSSTSSSSSRTSAATSSTASGPKAVHKTKDNPLLLGDQGTNTNTCNLPKWKSDPQSAQAFFKAALPCLEAEWKPVLQRAGLPYSSPNLAFPTGAKWTSACGTADSSTAAAFYCSGDNTLYMPFEGLQTKQSGAHPGVYLAVFAHEFGHHVQAVSGIMDASWDAEYDAGPDSATGLELNRRMEMQAQCFGGMWFAGAWNGKGSIDDNIVNEMLKDGYTRGDDNDPGSPRTHGTRAHYGAWQQQGYQKNRTYQCNTYAVPSDAVG
jgi:predicted metalloprotease